MADREELARLRAEANRALELTNRKRRSVTRKLGVKSLGRHEPRRPSRKQVNRYNVRQLESFIADSARFRSRSTQFTALGRGEVIPRSEWRQFDKVQRTRQRQQQEAFKSIEDIPIDSLGQTIGERRQMVSPPRARMMENNMWMEDSLRSPGQIPSQRALNKLKRKLNKANTGSEQKRARRQAMDSLDQMFPYMDSDAGRQIQQEIEALSDDQFYALWNIRDFAQDMSAYYESMKMLQSDTLSASTSTAVEGIAEDYQGEIRGLIDSVKQVRGTGRRF